MTNDALGSLLYKTCSFEILYCALVESFVSYLAEEAAIVHKAGASLGIASTQLQMCQSNLSRIVNVVMANTLFRLTVPLIVSKVSGRVVFAPVGYRLYQKQRPWYPVSRLGEAHIPASTSMAAIKSRLGRQFKHPSLTR